MNTYTTNKPPTLFKKIVRKISGFRTSTKLSLAWFTALLLWLGYVTPLGLIVVFLILLTGAAVSQLSWAISRELDRQHTERMRQYGK